MAEYKIKKRQTEELLAHANFDYGEEDEPDEEFNNLGVGSD